MAISDDAQGRPSASRLAVGPIHLRIHSLERVLPFYEELLGLEIVETAPSSDPTPIRLAAPRTGAGAEDHPTPLLVLHPDPEAPLRAPGAPGLFHTAFLLPDRRALGRMLRRLTDRGVGLDGASDHLVSEALYLSDPEGNGVELCADREESSWRTPSGRVRMASLPLDLESLLNASGGDGASLAPGTRVGHLHLRGPDPSEADRFFRQGLGLQVTSDEHPGALFFARGGYHHHFAWNRWGVAPDATWDPQATGLASWEVGFPEVQRDAARRGLEREGFPVENGDDGTLELDDPNGTPVRLRFGPVPWKAV